MKILQAVSYFPPAYAFGGPVNVAFHLSKALSKKGHALVVYTTNAKDTKSKLKANLNSSINEIIVRRFRILSFPLFKNYKPFITPQLLGFARNEVKNFDIIHLHEYRTFQNVILHHYAKKYGVPYVLQAHGSLPRIIAKGKLKKVYDFLFGYRLLRDAFKVFALNEVEFKQYVRMGVPKENIEVMPNGINLSEFDNFPSKGSFKKKFKIGDDEKILLFLGRIHKIKGLNILVQAFAEIAKEFSKTKLVIVGPDDGYLSTVETLVKQLGIDADNVLITGSLFDKEKIEAYIDSFVYVLPSLYEAFPMTILEAYACSKPVIASNLASLSKIITEGKTGLLFENGNEKELYRCLAFALKNSLKMEKMGLVCREFVEESFSLESIVNNFEDIYFKQINVKTS